MQLYIGSYFHETRNYVTLLNIFLLEASFNKFIVRLDFLLSFDIIGSFLPTFSHQSNKKKGVKIQQQSKGKSQLTKSLDINVSNYSLNPNK